jgi:hypothetical protein
MSGVTEVFVLRTPSSSSRGKAGMALTATIYNLDVQLADTDRGVYEALAFKSRSSPQSPTST